MDNKGEAETWPTNANVVSFEIFIAVLKKQNIANRLNSS
jgi:hypothetical protein